MRSERRHAPHRLVFGKGVSFEGTGRRCAICGGEIVRVYSGKERGLCLWDQWMTCSPSCQEVWSHRGHIFVEVNGELPLKGIQYKFHQLEYDRLEGGNTRRGYADKTLFRYQLDTH